jgi:hypothetical protein
MRYVFPYQLDAAARFIAALPPNAVVYWLSERWPADYETRRWLAPQATVIEQAHEFESPDVAPRPTVIILLGDYLAGADKWERRYPGGTWHAARRSDELLFRAYLLPSEARADHAR